MTESLIEQLEALKTQCFPPPNTPGDDATWRNAITACIEVVSQHTEKQFHPMGAGMSCTVPYTKHITSPDVDAIRSIIDQYEKDYGVTMNVISAKAAIAAMEPT